MYGIPWSLLQMNFSTTLFQKPKSDKNLPPLNPKLVVKSSNLVLSEEAAWQGGKSENNTEKQQTTQKFDSKVKVGSISQKLIDCKFYLRFWFIFLKMCNKITLMCIVEKNEFSIIANEPEQSKKLDLIGKQPWLSNSSKILKNHQKQPLLFIILSLQQNFKECIMNFHFCYRKMRF